MKGERIVKYMNGKKDSLSVQNKKKKRRERGKTKSVETETSKEKERERESRSDISYYTDYIFNCTHFLWPAASARCPRVEPPLLIKLATFLHCFVIKRIYIYTYNMPHKKCAQSLYCRVNCHSPLATYYFLHRNIFQFPEKKKTFFSLNLFRLFVIINMKIIIMTFFAVIYS